MSRRALGLLLQAILLCGLWPVGARADDYASRPITLIVPFTPGGSVDLVGRLVAPKMSERLGQPVVVLNVPGASGAIATQRLVNAAPDGYTLEIGTGREITTAKLINPNITYDPERDITYIALGAKSPIVIAGGPTLKQVKAFPDLLAEAHKRQLTFATSGVGSPQQFIGELIKLRAGVDMVHVPFSGGAGGLLEVLGSHVDMTIITLSSALEYIKAGKLQAYAIGDDKRTPFAPDIPALAEYKQFADVDMGIWYGLIAPPKLPADIVKRLNTFFREALSDPQVQAKMHEQGMTVVTDSTPESFEAFARKDIARYREIMQATKIQATMQVK